jgi:hypothetical protein
MTMRTAVVGALVLAACNGGGAGDTGTETEVGTTAPAPTATNTGSTAGPEPTTTTPDTTMSATTGSTGPSGPTTDGPGPTTTTMDPTTAGETDTGPSGLTCPLADGPGVMALALAPMLFAEGADPSGAEVCAIVNPDRGFHGYTDLRDLSAGDLEDNAAAGRSVIYGQVLIPEYRDAPLDDVVLDEVAAGFDLVREHGMKVVPRFHYSDDVGEPDAELSRILEHIEQLTPLLQAHADVILTLQAGFIGAYGEWHASTNGLDAPGPRKEILDALMAALPAERTVSVRRPSFKSDAYAGPVTADTAFDGSNLARLGHVNDCFLASDDDYGTYQEPGEKDYAVADSAFVPVGGETCGVNPPRSECPSALDELALLHWTHLNSAYHPDVLASWQDDGCYDEIACRLGYRLAVTQLRWTASAADGVVVSLELINDGFAAPVNERPLRLVLDGPERVEVIADFDVRTALPGEPRTVCHDFGPPGEAPAGMYRIGVKLADPAPSLAEDPRQAIRLANDAGVEWAEGINWFDAYVTVE